MKSILSRILRRGTTTRRGSGLATVLVITAIMVTLAFTVVGLSFHHLSSTTRMSNQMYAKELAEDAIAKTIDQFVSNPGFGTGLNETVIVTLNGAPQDSYGALTFCAANATYMSNHEGIATWHNSYNNLASDAPVPGDGCQVPGNAVYMSAIGICKGTSRRVDAVVYVPKFPYAMAASGPISGNDLYLAAVKAGGNVTNPADLMPADLASNRSTGVSVDFSVGNVIVNGDLQAASQATLGNSVVKGEERLNAAPVGLPTLHFTDYDTSSKAGVTNWTSTVNSTISGYNYSSGSLGAPTGLNLNGGVLYVNGDLTVGQGLSGQGAIIVNGTTTISGTSSFSGSNKVAIVSHGPINLPSAPGTGSQVTGLLYSDTRIDASNTQLRGTLIANDPTGADGRIAVVDSQVYQDSSASNFTVGVTTSGSTGNTTLPEGLATHGGIQGGTPMDLGPGGNQTFGPLNPKTNIIPPAPPLSQGGAANITGVPYQGNAPYILPGTFPVTLNIGLNVSLPDSRFYDTATHTYVAPMTFTNPQVDVNGIFVGSGTYIVVLDSSPGGWHYQPYSGGVPSLTAADFVLKTNNTFPINLIPMTDPTAFSVYGKATFLTALNQFALTSRGTALNASETTAASGIFMATQPNFWLAGATTQVGAVIAVATTSLNPGQNITFLDATDPTYVPPTFTSNTETWTINLNANSVVPLAQSIRVMYWRDIQ